MKGLIQRVSCASVDVDGQRIGEIDHGLLLLLGIERDDTSAIADKLLKKVINYRVFSDSDDKMNLNLQQVGGGLLIVSQFTLVADTQKGLRPGFVCFFACLLFFFWLLCFSCVFFVCLCLSLSVSAVQLQLAFQLTTTLTRFLPK